MCKTLNELDWLVSVLVLVLLGVATVREPASAQQAGRDRRSGGESNAERRESRGGPPGEFPGGGMRGGPPGEFPGGGMRGGPPGEFRGGGPPMWGGPGGGGPPMWGGPGGGGPGGGWGRGGGMGGGGMGFVARLDANGNGMLDPEESQGRARMFLESTGLDLTRPIPIDQVGKAFEDMRNRRMEEMGGFGRGEDRGGEGRGRGDDGQTDQGAGTTKAKPLVSGFGEPDMFDPVPGFGDLGEKFAVAIDEQDLQEAQRTMGRSDTNQDGVLDAEEIRNGRWGDDPLQTDRNRDGKLTLNELALRYAVRRAARDGGSSSSRSSNRSVARGGNSGGSTRNNATAGAEGDARQGRERMLQMMFGRYDRNGNGVLEKDEWGSFRSDPSGYDTNHDGKITREEFAAAMATRFGGGGGGEGEGDRSRWYSRREGEEGPPKAGETPTEGEAATAGSKKSYRFRSAAERLGKYEGLPEWFARADANGDGQVKMAEYSTSWTDQVVADFAQFDLNKDGIVTPSECVKATESGAVQGAAAPVTPGDHSNARGDSRSRSEDRPAPDRDELPAEASSSPAAAPTAAAETSAASGDVPPKYIKYAVSFIKRYDTNKDGVLTQDEWTKMNTDYSSADADKDGRITPTELGAAFVKKS